jgi:hypothetical protein
VNAAYDVYGDLRRPDGVPDELQRAIVALADRLRHHHYEGDGCVDEADDQDEPQASTSGLETEEPRSTDLVDYDLCWAFDLVDPWGNRYELNCYDYDRVEAELFEADAVEVDRYWPREVYEAYVEATSP